MNQLWVCDTNLMMVGGGHCNVNLLFAVYLGVLFQYFKLPSEGVPAQPLFQAGEKAQVLWKANTTNSSSQLLVGSIVGGH
jgi:hypothetical protein